MQFSYANGWGYEYVSDFSLAEVGAYVVAYAVGCVAFGGVVRRYPVVAGASVVLCAVGVATFGLEATHWVVRHHLSLIASCPALLMASAVYVIVREGLRGRREAHLSATHGRSDPGILEA
jgi:hypothetical protein